MKYVITVDVTDISVPDSSSVIQQVIDALKTLPRDFVVNVEEVVAESPPVEDPLPPLEGP